MSIFEKYFEAILSLKILRFWETFRKLGLGSKLGFLEHIVEL